MVWVLLLVKLNYLFRSYTVSDTIFPRDFFDTYSTPSSVFLFYFELFAKAFRYFRKK